MNTYTPYSQATETYRFPSSPDAGTASAVVYYHLGDTVVSTISPTLVSGTTYSLVVPDDYFGSYGVYRIKWTCKIGGVDFYDYTEFNIEDIYVTEENFLNEYSDFDSPDFKPKFVANEKIARRIIDTYTGQNFQFIKNKTYNFDGNDRDTLYVGQRLNSFSSVLFDQTDMTSAVRMDFQSKYFLKTIAPYPWPEGNIEDLRTKVFPKKSVITVTGDWGWMSVPWQIEQATSLLIADLMNDVKRENRRYGIRRIEQDSHRLEFDPSIFNSTGNIDVDTLLMDFVVWTMDYVS